MKAATTVRILLGVALGFGVAGGVAQAGDVESFNSRLFDLQYFGRPAERMSSPGGGVGDPTLNPAALGMGTGAELRTYANLHVIEGATYGLEELIPPGPGRPEPQRIYETPTARVAGLGAEQTFALGPLPGTLAVMADGLNNDLTDNEVSGIEQSGTRLGLAYGAPLSDALAAGAEAVYFADVWQWTVTWPHFDAGSALPRNVDYVLRSEGGSWRFRGGLQGRKGEAFRYGLTGEWGTGDTDNEWNGMNPGGGDDMRHSGARGDVEFDLRPQVTVAAAMEWQATDIEFGNHHAGIDPAAASTAEWEAEVLRPMLGVRFSPAADWQFRGGYRHSFFDVGDLCGKTADNDYGTVAFGMAFAGGRFAARADAEYSTVDPHGEWAGALALQAKF